MGRHTDPQSRPGLPGQQLVQGEAVAPGSLQRQHECRWVGVLAGGGDVPEGVEQVEVECEAEGAGHVPLGCVPRGNNRQKTQCCIQDVGIVYCRNLG